MNRLDAVFLSAVWSGGVLMMAVWTSEVRAAEPTLAETIEYIDTKFSQCGSVSYKIKQELPKGLPKRVSDQWLPAGADRNIETTVSMSDSRAFHFEENVVETKWWHNETNGSRLRMLANEKTVGRVSLRDLITAVDTRKQRLIVQCSKKDCMDVEVTTEGRVYLDKEGRNVQPEKKVSSVSSYSFHVCEQHAERIRKALIHAIRITGGKDDLF